MAERALDSSVTSPAPHAVDAVMARWLSRRALPRKLREAVRYSLLAPGKRTRPTLVLASCAAVGGKPERALVPAAAIEMVHTFSLVHDDLPALDGDELRRGRPTLHVAQGEAVALLAGDALFGLAFELLLGGMSDSGLAARLCRELVHGANEMIAGQVYDVVGGFERGMSPIDRLRTMHAKKTGALVRAACRMGALCGGATSAQVRALTRFGEALGLMFQVGDDVLDVTQPSARLGKTAGKDIAHGKCTYPALVGLAESRRIVQSLEARALAALAPLGQRAASLRTLCQRLAVRTH